MSSAEYDVIVIGAGPAGAAAAISLAQKEHDVALIDREVYPRKGAAVGWLGARAAPLLAELGVSQKAPLTRRFRDVTFHTADFSKTARPGSDVVFGYLIDCTGFGNTLVAAARKHGVKVVSGNAAADLHLKENAVLVDLANGEQIRSRLLLLASGRGSILLDRVSIGRSASSPVIWSAQVEASFEAAPAGPVPRVGIMLGLDKAGSFGLWGVLEDRLWISVNWLGDRQEAVRSLVDICKSAVEKEVVPADLSSQAAGATLVPSAAGAALDSDTHVGKHTLLIGDAGGFIAAVSNEGVYPAMWSARIAADVAGRALKSVHSQDELMAFDSEWRIQMADYLRAPNTDSQFLIPLVFSNQAMADRMAAAFFWGENI